MIKVFCLIGMLFSLAFSAEQKSISVTYTVLGSLVKELVGDKAKVETIIPNGQDMHEWKPSAKDVQKMLKSDLIIQNGFDAEEGLEKSINLAKKKGIKVFTASNYIQARKANIAHNEHGHKHAAFDPHFWLDPLSIKAVVIALNDSLKKDFAIDTSDNCLKITKKLDELNSEILNKTSQIPQKNKKLVTGHDSLGYYAARYNFEVIGAVIPSLSTGAQASAAQIAKLEKLIKKTNIPAIFTELGTPKQVVETISKDTGVKVVELSDHILPADGLYYTMMSNMTNSITEALK